MEFEWDPVKCSQNIKKHGIDFNDVKDVFQKPMLVWIDNRKDYGEDRWVGVGLIKTITITVVYTETDDEVIRIISARKATNYEKEKYQSSYED